MVSGNKKTAAALAILLLVICIMLVVAEVYAPAHSVRPGEGSVDPASGIHITESGDITDSQGTDSSTIIQRDGNVYTLTANITSMVTIEKSNIVFDGGGFAFKGSHGLKLSRVENVTVKNLLIDTRYLYLWLDHTYRSMVQNVSSSIQLSDSNYNVIDNCTTGINLERANYNTVKNSNTGEIELNQANGNSILYNTISTQGPSLGIWDSSNNVIFGNTFSKFWWWITMTPHSTNNKIVANNVWAGQLYLADELVGTNYVYHNNFYNFKWNQSTTTNSANVWSSEMRGNYWANFYTGDNNHDGIVDSPFTIDKTNKDQYPLTAPVDISAEHVPS